MSNPVIETRPPSEPAALSPPPTVPLGDDLAPSREPLRTPAGNSNATVSRSTSLSSPSRRSKSSSRQRSLSPATSPMQALDALAGSPAPQQASPSTTSTSGNKIPPPSNAFASRPSPVVPPSPSVSGTPHHHYPNSRPTSPRPSRHASEEPSSPTRERATAAATGAMLGDAVSSTGMGRSSSQVDLSHIFERDVEFAPSHHITPSEAVDVAVPPVLTEAIMALSATDDPVVSHDVEALIHESEADAQAGSGWSSPVMPPPHSLPHSHSHSHGHGAHPLSQHHHSSASPPTFSHSAYANASRSPVRSSHSRSFSPDSVEGIEALSSGGEDRRAASPGGSSTTFSGGSPPTSAGEISPPSTSAGGGAFGLGPFGKKLAEALENEANKLPPGLVGSAPSTSPATAATAPVDKSPRTSSASSFANLSPLRPANILSSPSSSLSVPFPAVGSSPSPSPSSPDPNHPLVVASPSSISPQTELNSNPLGAGPNVANPHPRRLSFISYADVINEERMAELTGEGTATGTATPAIGKGPKGGIGAELVEGRLASLLLSD
ncbi:hypothetical protein JCM3766R1_005842 [Sporobolomyces carnicolor]